MPAPPTPSDTSELPAYDDHASWHSRAVERGSPAQPHVAFAVVAAIGVALILLPIVLGMFPRSAKGERMLAEFGPYMSTAHVDSLQADLQAIEGARQNVLTLQGSGNAPTGQYSYVDTFVRDYPAIRADMSSMLDTMSANVANYEQLSSLPPFSAMPWFFALPGAALTAIGIIGFRRARRGDRSPVLTAAGVLLGAGLVIAPLAFGIFEKAPAADPILDDFSTVLTHDEVRKVQGYFVTLVGGQGELNSRYTKAVRDSHPAADLGGIDELENRWQPMTSEFAGLIGVMNDNVENFDSVAALNDSTTAIGFRAFGQLGWFFVLPGVATVAALGAGPVRKLVKRR
ncbi:hypothetical protein [Antrihabitans sp. YC2-6]|uniref:hypothetical protein n=1 Tax=Antrihabitans sp. YC2-6 TaxID=2799498 RepID=UPI0018F2E9FA|nr:hypothetical protein [Antrihabitans sp. YC2-6]MBJ8348180.1 hypothetical protein [Antrihabitans sp. YC2-6]